jgi:hypothetical protein
MEDYAYESVYTVVSLLTQYFPMIRMVTSTPEMKYINGSYLIKFHLDSGVKYYHSVDFAKAPHIMTIGGTGSGKTYLNQLIVAKVSVRTTSLQKVLKKYMSMIATLVLMGRSFNVHCLISTQRPDASYFSSGVRDSIAVVIALGNLSKEGKSMLFKDYEENMFPLFSIGAGYMLINGSEFTAIQVPRIKYIEKMESCIQDILDR